MGRFVWMICLLLAAPAAAEGLRVATYDPALTRKGPGLLLRDIRREDPQVLAAAEVIAAAAPDVILLTGIHWDHDGLALAAFAQVLGQAGHPMPHNFAARPNSGMPTGLDLDGDGRTGGRAMRRVSASSRGKMPWPSCRACRWAR